MFSTLKYFHKIIQCISSIFFTDKVSTQKSTDVCIDKPIWLEYEYLEIFYLRRSYFYQKQFINEGKYQSPNCTIIPTFHFPMGDKLHISGLVMSHRTFTNTPYYNLMDKRSGSSQCRRHKTEINYGLLTQFDMYWGLLLRKI